MLRNMDLDLSSVESRLKTLMFRHKQSGHPGPVNGGSDVGLWISDQRILFRGQVMDSPFIADASNVTGSQRRSFYRGWVWLPGNGFVC